MTDSKCTPNPEILFCEPAGCLRPIFKDHGERCAHFFFTASCGVCHPLSFHLSSFPSSFLAPLVNSRIQSVLMVATKGIGWATLKSMLMGLEQRKQVTIVSF